MLPKLEQSFAKLLAMSAHSIIGELSESLVAREESTPELDGDFLPAMPGIFERAILSSPHLSTDQALSSLTMKHPFSIFSLLVAALCVAVFSAVVPATAAVNVTQHHNHDSRDGLYIDPAFTQANASNLTRDTSFNGTISGNVYAQPLYIEGGPGGTAMVIAVTESNNVYALDAANGSIIWQRNVGTAVSSSSLPCGNVNPLGITGTPIMDLPSRSLFLDAMTTPDGGTTKKHLIFSLNVDTGAINSGWPVDVNAVAVSGTTSFTSSVQSQRSALGIVGNILYVPYGGHYGDCGNYHGWMVGVRIDNPATVLAWATTATGGGIWGPGGVASDGANPFIVTGNTFNTGGTWKGGEAVIRFQPGPVFSGLTNDYWAPANWLALDNSDTDLGGSGPLLVDVPGAVPSNLVVALGKDGNAYLLNRNNFGGISAAVAQSQVSSSAIIQAAAAYRTAQGTYVVFRASSGALVAFRINPTSPPTITSAWSVSQSGRGSPFVTSTDGTNNVIVWAVGAEGDQRLHGYDGDTGGVLYAGGSTNELMAGTRRFSTGIAARGRIYIATDNKVYAFTVAPSTFISQSDCLFNWAEITYPNLFAPRGMISNTLAPYYYRYYPQTKADLGTSSVDSHVYYLGPLPNNSIFDVGPLSPLLSAAGCQ